MGANLVIIAVLEDVQEEQIKIVNHVQQAISIIQANVFLLVLQEQPR